MSQKSGDRKGENVEQESEDKLFEFKGGSLKRAFPVKAIENCDLLTLSK